MLIVVYVLSFHFGKLAFDIDKEAEEQNLYLGGMVSIGLRLGLIVILFTTVAMFR